MNLPAIHYNDSPSFEDSDVKQRKILVVEDDQLLREAVCDTLEISNFKSIEARSAEQALEKLAVVDDIAMIVSDVNMGVMSGHELLSIVRERYPHIPMLLVTAYASVNDSVQAMRNGAVDYLVKPYASQLLIDAVNRHAGKGYSDNDDEPVAVSSSSLKLLALAKRVAHSDSTVLIVGESGSGKEVLARYIHQHSNRSDKPFIAINCAAIPENMLEAMLFGHEKGAYTGAHTSAPGKFEQAEGGTLLLDEISEMDLGLQAKLLRVLQEKEVERLGGRKTIQLNVRVIATSNRNLQQSVIDGDFREDLYYRLSVLPLQWEPLRHRLDDIVPLACRLLSHHALKQCRQSVTLTENAKLALLSYSWPGNVRELDNVMQRSLILQPGNTIDADDLGLEVINNSDTIHYTSSNTSNDNHNHNNNHIKNNRFNKISDHRNVLAENGSLEVNNRANIASNISDERSDESPALGRDLKKKEFELIVDAIRQAGGSRKLTAERLGISPRTLRYKISRLTDDGFDVNRTVKNLV
ncbi:MAG: sigma-54-dependent transcriptional regulator [Cellvibrionaceae bacterium]